MGQYYRPTAAGTNTFVRCYDFDSGAKLMEHSWMKNHFVQFVESLLVEGGIWNGKPIVWAGDYADGEKDKNGNPLTYKEGENEYDLTLYNMTKIKLEPEDIKDFKPKFYRYLINETKKCFIDKTKVPEDNDGWKIHPLPLMTCEGNGRGGGDFCVDNERNQGNTDLIGTWARDVITVSTKKPKGYEEIDFNIVE